MKKNDEITVHTVNKRAFKIIKTPTRSELIERLRALSGTIPSDFKFDRIDANQRR
jgi:antitoxin MazE